MTRPVPNIVLIFVDNRPTGMLGCAGNREIHTPHLDGLAARGVRFSEAFCANAISSPIWTNVETSRETRRTELISQSCRPGSTPSSPGTRMPSGTSGEAEP